MPTKTINYIDPKIREIKEWIKLRDNRICLMIVIVLFAAVAVCAVLLNKAAADHVPTSASQMVFEKAEVTAVLSDDAQPDYDNAEGRRVGTQELEIRILTGDHKDEIMSLTNYMSALFNVDLEKGDNIIVRIMTDEDGAYYASVFNYDRGIVVGAFVLIFFVLLAILGGKKGIGALIGLLFTLSCIWFILIPAIITGLPVIPVTVIVIGVTSAGALLLLNGLSRKTFCAVLGCFIGVLTAGIIAALVGAITPINGFNMTEAENLILYGADKGLKISGLLVCGVLISALGAVMDVALGIASSVNELRINNPKATAKELFKSGMNIGKDAMGTMANTLILAFAGSSLNMLILVQTYDIPFRQLINTDYICIEIIQSISGAVGILLTVPIVALISAAVMSGQKSGR
ncbi:MAG: YibE/F family protein [Anaerovoracaceae bacterium]